MLSFTETLVRLSLASLFGAFIGLERERKDWAAGMRTHMMVCVGACLIMLVSSFGFADVLGSPNIELDPSRVAAQVVSGIGFLGAGTILFLKGGIVRGLTTASGLWTVAAIGLATGGGMYFAAIATTVIAIIILWALQPLERLYNKQFRKKTLKIIATQGVSDTNILSTLLKNEKLKVENFTFERTDNEIIIQLRLDSKSDSYRIADIINDLNKDQAIKDIYWT